MATSNYADDDDGVVLVEVSCVEVVEGLIAGDREAADQVFRRYVDALVGTAAGRIPTAMRVKVDPASVVASVMESLLDMRPPLRDHLVRYEIRNWGQLFGLLAVMTVRRAANRLRRFQGRGRDAAREQAIGDTPLVAGGPSAVDEAAFVELVDGLRAVFGLDQWAVVELLMDGHSIRETAERAGRTTTFVRMVRDKLVAALRKLDQSSGAAEPPADDGP